MAYDHRNIGFAPYGPYWRNMRKLCILELLSNFKINQFQAMREVEMGLFVGTMKRAAHRGEIVDVSASVLGLTRDMICQMVFGRKFSDSDMDGKKGFQEVSLEATKLAGSFNLGDYFPFLGALDLQGLTRRMKGLRKDYDKFMERIIDDHIRSKGVKKDAHDFVDTLMEILETGDAGFEFDRRHVKAVLLDMVLAGMDTSALTVDWALSELIKHHQVMKKLQVELEAIFGMDKVVDELYLDKIEYLDFVVKEALRLHPIAPLLIPHESMEDCNVSGFHIPKKSRILVNVWAMGRDPEVWSDPLTFLPERFIESNIDLRGHNFELIPFGSGRRICPGLQLGLTMVKYVLAQLVHCFDWELSNGMLPDDLDMSEQFGLAMARANHLMAKPKYRLSN